MRNAAVLLVALACGVGTVIAAEPVDGDCPELQERLDYLEQRARMLSDLMWRIVWAEFQPERSGKPDVGCTLPSNPWNLTNEWVVRELYHDLIRARYPTGLDPSEDQRVAEFFAYWQPGDRLFSYQAPAPVPSHGNMFDNESGYIIIRDCRVVGKLIIGFL